MKLQRSPLILLLIALVLGGFVYFHEVRNTLQTEAGKPATQKLFSFTEEQVQSLTVKTSQQTLAFVTASQPQAGESKWLMKAPVETPASEASVAYLLNLMATGSSDRTLNAAANQQADFGFDSPLATVEVKLDNQQTHRLILGKPNFNRQFLYAQADPSANQTANLSVLLVSPNLENAVKRPLAEWKSAESKRDRLSQPKSKELK